MDPINLMTTNLQFPKYVADGAVPNYTVSFHSS